MNYTHTLICLSHERKPKYSLPAFPLTETSDYWIYSRPHPIVYHHRKNKTLVLPHPEAVLVAKNAHHCISIAFKDLEPINMYININLIPEAVPQGHQWVDLELDIQRIKDSGAWTSRLLDEDEFAAADLSEEQRALALKETERLFTQIEKQQFPFCDTELQALLQGRCQWPG